MPFWSFANGSQHASLLKNVIILFFVSSLTITGCQSAGDDTADLKLNWEIEPDPPRVGKAIINITLKDSTKQLIEGVDITLEGNMSHPGMAPVIAKAEETAPGEYSAEMKFTMGGDWIILITSTLANERVVERQIEVPGVRSE